MQNWLFPNKQYFKFCYCALLNWPGGADLGSVYFIKTVLPGTVFGSTKINFNGARHITSHTLISDKHGCQYYLYWCHIPLNCFHQYFNNGCFLTELFLLNKSLRSYYWCRLVDGKNLALSIPLYILILQDPQLDFIRATANFPNWKAHDRIIFLGSLSLGVVMCWFWSRKRESDWYMSPSSSWWRSHSPWLTC